MNLQFYQLLYMAEKLVHHHFKGRTDIKAGSKQTVLENFLI
jgi:hypothetical protein